MFEVIEVNNINNNRKPGIIPSNFIGGRSKFGFVIGEIINPHTIKKPNKTINIKVNNSRALRAIFCVLKINMPVKRTGMIDMIVTNKSETGMFN